MKKDIKLRSRILEYFPKELLEKIQKLIKDVRISDNNEKTDLLVGLLDAYIKDKYIELGPGTNRFAILIDNYVFKIALDKWGIRDNINEFNMSQELQPYVVKTYETNRIISVCEYVTVISKEEFIKKREDIQRILGILADSYLLGDVGTISKNYLNWGYRDNGELVILDYAYIYNIKGDEILCSNCQMEILEYDENFHNLICPRCHTKYSFIDIRRKIPSEVETKEAEIALSRAYKLTKPVEVISNEYQQVKQEVKQEIEQQEEIKCKEEINMSEHMDYYKEMLEMLNSESSKPNDDKKEVEENAGVKFIPAETKEETQEKEANITDEPADMITEVDDELCDDQVIKNLTSIRRLVYDYTVLNSNTNSVDDEETEEKDDECDEDEIDEVEEETDETRTDEDKVIEVHNEDEVVQNIKVIEADSEEVEQLRKEIQALADEDEEFDDEFESYYDDLDKIKSVNKGVKNPRWD